MSLREPGDDESGRYGVAHLAIQLLGSFWVTLDGEPVTAFESDRVRALLAYLAMEADRPHRRESLVGLLWPDWPEPSARKNLNQALYNLRAAIGDREADPPFLLISPKTLQFNSEGDRSLDVAHLAGVRDDASVEQVEAATVDRQRATREAAFLCG
jgi:DNA-binding SARP family transcriptional activator